jgi:S-adenosylmethionine hydrolase
VIVLFTDFGARGPYVGQMRAVLVREAPQVPVIELLNDAPSFAPLAAAYLLAAYVEEFPPGTVFLGVVDPGVGGARRPLVVEVDGRWFVGPDNGLFEVVVARGTQVCWWEITWRPQRLSPSFHGRDLFAPVAARLASGEPPPGELISERAAFDGPEDLPRVIYLDVFGNAVTGLRAARLPLDAILRLREHNLLHARTFSDVPKGQAFWYENANGLVEIAVNQGNAASQLGITIGDEVTVDELRGRV